jgi:predicted transcriptional regulator
MGQVTIYLDDETEAKMRAAAKGLHLSKSKWLAKLIEEKVADQWPESVIGLAGAWKDFPDREKIGASAGRDITREAL